MLNKKLFEIDVYVYIVNDRNESGCDDLIPSKIMSYVVIE